jgi:hypothetical protein
MKRKFFTLCMLVILAHSFAGERSLVDLSNSAVMETIQKTDVQLQQQGGVLRISTGHQQPWPGITIKAPDGRWDLTGVQAIVAELKNLSDIPVKIHLRVDNPGADGTKNCITNSVALEAGQAGTLRVALCDTPWALDKPLKLVGMRGYPKVPDSIDAANITQLILFIARPQCDYTFELYRLAAEGDVKMLTADTFLPFIDRFGQFIHADWPGKSHTEEDLARVLAAEEKELTEKPAPADRNQYGGWTAGPHYKATGFFRVEKINGKWWLIDPEGCLFWSHGVDCVGVSNATPLTDRETYFSELPEPESPYAVFYGRGNWAPVDYYKGRGEYRTFDFSAANLARKYGPDWRSEHADMAHRRLRSWGMNTIANWSDRDIYQQRKTPYVTTISAGSRTIEGSEGYWGKFFDVFDPDFRRSLGRAMESQKGRSVDDPWCIGFFVHNELSWGDDTSLSLAVLASPPDQPAKPAFVEMLKKKYTTIDALNTAWATRYASWQAMLDSTRQPDKEKAGDDLRAFYTILAETYFRIVNEEVKRAAPHQLYLGCRFAWVNDLAAIASAKFCDVVSYNRYEYSVESLQMPEKIDKPLLIGEFHFGALDRGMFHTGLRVAKDQLDRAEKYRSYVFGALRNPYIVGTHWFQFRDQATTGRGDGENYQIGLVDICDTPYPEMIAALRDVGRQMYAYRLKEESADQMNKR